MINSRSINRTIKKSVKFLALLENAICYLRTTRLIVKFWTTFLAKKICVTVCSDFRWCIRSRQVITKANRLLGLLRRSASRSATPMPIDVLLVSTEVESRRRFPSVEPAICQTVAALRNNSTKGHKVYSPAALSNFRQI